VSLAPPCSVFSHGPRRIAASLPFVLLLSLKLRPDARMKSSIMDACRNSFGDCLSGISTLLIDGTSSRPFPILPNLVVVLGQSRPTPFLVFNTAFSAPSPALGCVPVKETDLMCGFSPRLAYHRHVLRGTAHDQSHELLWPTHITLPDFLLVPSVRMHWFYLPDD
jgi:hypothetical protein